MDSRAGSPRPWFWAGAGLAGVLALAYLRVLFLGDTFAVRDHLSWTLPSRRYLADSLRHGRLPQWWDALRLGERFAADPNHGVTYPPTWLVALVDPLFGADLLLLLHILLAGVGVLLLARRLGASPLGGFFGAAALMTSGYMTSMVVNGSILMALGWMPLVCWAALGIAEVEARGHFLRRGLVFAAVLAGSVASGNPAHVNNIVLASAVVLLCARRRPAAMLSLALAGLLGAAMGAASLLPPLLTLSDSTRAGGLTLSQSGAWSMHPVRLLELVWPQLLGQGLRPELSLASLWAHGGGSLEATWSGSLHVGLPVLLCAGLGASRGMARRLGLLSLAFLVLALGTFTPVYGAYRAVFWFERILRYPEKHLATALVLWSALAALGFDAWLAPAAKRRLTVASALAIVLLVALGLAHLGRANLEQVIAQASRGRGMGIDATAAVGSVLDGGLWAALVAVGVVVATAFANHPRLGNLMRPAFVVLSIGQLVVHDWTTHVLIAREVVRGKPAILAPLDPGTRETPTRILRRTDDITPISVSGEARAVYLHQLARENAATAFGFAQVPGYSIAGTPRFDALAAASGKANLERIMDLLDVRYLIIRAAEAGAMGMPVATPGALAGHVVLENSGRRPRAYVAHRFGHYASDQAILDQVFAPDRAGLDLGAVRLSGVGDVESQIADPPSPCQIERPVPEQVRLTCDAAKPGYAVLLDEWTRGWTATVDGQPATIERADTVFRAVRVGQGRHLVEMRYRTPGLRLGAGVALAAWLLFMTVLGRRLVLDRRA